MMNRTLACALSLLVVGVGCDMSDDQDPGTGGATSSSTGSGGATGGAGGAGGSGGAGGDDPAPTGLTVMTANGPAPADLSCLGQGTEPSPSDDTTLIYPALSFGQVDAMGNPVAVAGLEIQVFPDNAIPLDDACSGDCFLADDQGGGTYAFTVPGDAWFAYRVLERPAQGMAPAVLRTMEVNSEPSPGEWFGTFFVPVLEGLYQSLAIPQATDRATLAGRFTDCNGDSVQGATLTLADAGGSAIPFDDATALLYLDPLPDPSLTATGPEGRYAITNVPTGSGEVLVRVWSPNGVLVGCELVAVAPNAQSGSRVRPLRADAAAACAD